MVKRLVRIALLLVALVLVLAVVAVIYVDTAARKTLVGSVERRLWHTDAHRTRHAPAIRLGDVGEGAPRLRRCLPERAQQLHQREIADVARLRGSSGVVYLVGDASVIAFRHPVYAPSVLDSQWNGWVVR